MTVYDFPDGLKKEKLITSNYGNNNLFLFTIYHSIVNRNHWTLLHCFYSISYTLGNFFNNNSKIIKILQFHCLTASAAYR